MRAAESLSTQLGVKLFDDHTIFKNVLEHQKAGILEMHCLATLCVSQVYLAFKGSKLSPKESATDIDIGRFGDAFHSSCSLVSICGLGLPA